MGISLFNRSVRSCQYTPEEYAEVIAAIGSHTLVEDYLNYRESQTDSDDGWTHRSSAYKILVSPILAM